MSLMPTQYRRIRSATTTSTLRPAKGASASVSTFSRMRGALRWWIAQSYATMDVRQPPVLPRNWPRGGDPLSQVAYSAYVHRAVAYPVETVPRCCQSILFATLLLPIDTTSDTTEDATYRNVEQPPARKSAYLSRFCNMQQPLEAGVGGMWLRRSRV
jgi:hypothetical protein